MKKLNISLPTLLIGFVLLAIWLAFDSTVSGLTFAALGGIYNDGLTHHRDLVAKKMKTIAWNVPIWSKFMGMINKVDLPEAPKYGMPKMFKPTGQPIEVLKDFTQGGFEMDIPVDYPLTGKGVKGARQLLTNEEIQKLLNMKARIYQMRHGVVIQDNKLSKQALQHPQIIKKLMTGAGDKLGDWFQRWNGYNIGLAFLQGVSDHIASAKALDGGAGIGRASHMNTYVAGSGRVAFSNTKATYEAAVVSAINGLTATSSDYMSAKLIKLMIYEAVHTHKIISPLSDGLFPIVISDAAMWQLTEDADFKAALTYAQMRGLQNQLFTGKYAEIPFAGALLIVDETLPAARLDGDDDFDANYSTLGTTAGIQYGIGADFMATPVDPGNKKPAILFGKSAIGVGTTSDLNFENEDYDYKQRKTEGADIMIGHTRADILDSDGDLGLSGDKRYANMSSLVAWSYSPANPSWT